MEAKSHTVFLEDEFTTAKENMAFDLSLAETLVPDTRCFRFYLWQKSGITYSFKQTVPQSLLKLSCGQRPTGGGIVFHCPNDLVFSCVGWLNDPVFPRHLRDKMGWLTEAIEEGMFQSVGVSLEASQRMSSKKDLDFCNTSPNPYERYLNDQKVLALTLRRFRDRFLIQGIIHLSANEATFSELRDSNAMVFTRGLLSQLTRSQRAKFAVSELRQQIFQALSRRSSVGSSFSDLREHIVS